MKDLQRETAKLLLKSSQGIAKVIPAASFEFWERKEFRELVNFTKLSRTEQDRMFNELEVSLLGLFDLHLTYIASIAQNEYRKVISILQKELVASFIALFSELGVEKKHINIWNVLIDMRFKEYWKHYKAALKEARGWKEFKGDDYMRVTWARIETITIDCLRHIRRGKVEKDDPLWKLLRKWFTMLDAITIGQFEKLVGENPEET